MKFLLTTLAIFAIGGLGYVFALNSNSINVEDGAYEKEAEVVQLFKCDFSKCSYRVHFPIGTTFTEIWHTSSKVNSKILYKKCQYKAPNVREARGGRWDHLVKKPHNNLLSNEYCEDFAYTKKS